MAEDGKSSVPRWIVVSTALAGLVSATLSAGTSYYQLRKAQAEAANAQSPQPGPQPEPKPAPKPGPPAGKDGSAPQAPDRSKPGKPAVSWKSLAGTYEC